MNTTAIRNKVKSQMEVGFTMQEAFQNVRENMRTAGTKTNKVAEARAKAQEANGTYEYGNFGKEYANRKFAK